MPSRLWNAAPLVFLGVTVGWAQSPARQDQGHQTVRVGQAGIQDRGEQPRQAATNGEFEAIQAEWLAARKAAAEARKADTTAQEKKQAAVAGNGPDVLAYARRFLALAEANPDGPQARDALLWIVMREQSPRLAKAAGSPWIEPSSELLRRAVDLLTRHHANDLQVARAALFLSDVSNLLPSDNRDRLFGALYEKAQDRVVKGTATLALAQYVERKARLAVILRKTTDPFPNQFTADYEKHLRGCDPEATKAEAVRLLDHVITAYGDVPFVRARGADTFVSEGGRGSRALTEADLARKVTLAQAAESRLDEMLNLAVGKPAPEIDGADFDGKPLKLSDFRGKVVVLVFWGTWCGLCMEQVPHERKLVERLKGQPFALLGVDCLDDKEVACRVMERERMTWPSWYDGAKDAGPISERYHIIGFPSIFVLDAKGIIRAKGARGVPLDRVVDSLLKEMATPAVGRGTP
jgi:thiol-disulfide isomerase/thioredoxin